MRNWNSNSPVRQQAPTPEEIANLSRSLCSSLATVAARFKAPPSFENGDLVEPARVLEDDPAQPLPGVVLRPIPNMFDATDDGEDKGLPGYLIARIDQDYEGLIRIEIVTMHAYRLQAFSGPRPEGDGA